MSRRQSHTPGPWRFDLFNDQPAIYADVQGEPYVVALMEGGHGRAPEDELDANTHLIAAAPDLLRALRRVLAVTLSLPYDGRTLTGKAFRQAEAAIAKAEGHQ